MSRISTCISFRDASGDGFDIPLPFDGSSMPDRTVLDAYAARIIAALDDPVWPGHRGASAPGGAPGNASPIDTPLKETELPLEEGAQGELVRNGSSREARGSG